MKNLIITLRILFRFAGQWQPQKECYSQAGYEYRDYTIIFPKVSLQIFIWLTVSGATPHL